MKIPYDPTKVKEYTSQLTVRSSDLKPLTENLLYNDDKQGLIVDSECELWSCIFASRKIPFNDDSIFFTLLASMVSIACHIMNTSSEYHSMLNELKTNVNEMLHNAKISLTLSLLTIRNNYNSLHPFFLKAQILVDFEILFKVLIYTCVNAPRINHNLIQSMSVETDYEISLDEMNEKYFMNASSSDDMQLKIIVFINNCLTNIDKRIQLMEASYKVKLDWINVSKFMIGLMKENIKYYFDKTYYEFVYKLLKLTYKNKDYSVFRLFLNEIDNFLESRRILQEVSLQYRCASKANQMSIPDSKTH